MIHACEQCGRRWTCAGTADGGGGHHHSPLCAGCFRAVLASVGQKLVLVECRICTARRHCQCPLDAEPENLPCPNCGAEAMDAVECAA